MMSGALASDGKVSVSTGYFAIAAKSSGESSSVSNPSMFHIGYLQPRWDNFEFKIGYTMLMADFSGSDLGYGLDAGLNYYPFSDASDHKLQTQILNAKSYQQWRPMVGFSFNQRNFQSVRNSYAGFGFNAGVERYYDEEINFKGEVRYVSMSGSNESVATETALLFGVVFKL
jgi:hypothetical protein